MAHHLRVLPLAALAVLIGGTAAAQGVSARFGNDVATIGRPVEVNLEVEDPAGVVDRVRVELRRADQATWTATAAVDLGEGQWQARFPADVWGAGEAPGHLELRALMYGRRGGLLMVLGELEPFEMDALPPALAEAREKALTRASAAPPEVVGADSFSLAGYVGVEGRLGSSARARAFIGAGGGVTDHVELLGRVVVGPAFAEPDDLAGGGPLALAFEAGARLYVHPLGSAWNLFAEPCGAVELRLPGVDAGAGLRAGAMLWISPEVAVDVSLGGLVMAMALSPAEGEDTHLGFMGGLRLGIRFGPERRREQAR
ncbi:MAG: hypothetical protein KC933_31890 [Myxococcales bacterium]|nr:hypothetical protein [Myxococcales bacterium]